MICINANDVADPEPSMVVQLRKWQKEGATLIAASMSGETKDTPFGFVKRSIGVEQFMEEGMFEHELLSIVYDHAMRMT